MRRLRTWSKEEIISTPLQPLHDRYAKTLKYETPDRRLNLDELPGHSYTIWASTPAIAQELGIHVHVFKGAKPVIDDTFGEVILNGTKLNRIELIGMMIARSVV